MPQQLQEGHDDEPGEAQNRVGAARQMQRHLANSGNKAGQGVVSRNRVRQGGAGAVRPHLIEQRCEAGPHIGHRDGVAARRQLGIGALQQPGTGGIQPLDPGEIEQDLSPARQIERAQPPVEFGGGGEQPIALGPKDQRVRLCGGDKGCARRHALKVLADHCRMAPALFN